MTLENLKKLTESLTTLNEQLRQEFRPMERLKLIEQFQALVWSPVPIPVRTSNNISRLNFGDRRLRG